MRESEPSEAGRDVVVGKTVVDLYLPGAGDSFAATVRAYDPVSARAGFRYSKITAEDLVNPDYVHTWTWVRDVPFSPTLSAPRPFWTWRGETDT